MIHKVYDAAFFNEWNLKKISCTSIDASLRDDIGRMTGFDM
jgi:hypothetical protein